MSTSGIQNYLSNVFRPVYVYNTSTFNFIPKLELSNIDTYSGNIVSVVRADVGDDDNGNVYVGLQSGNPIATVKGCTFVTALGYFAGHDISNDTRSVYLGYQAGQGGQNTSDVIAIGASSKTGPKSIYIGTSNGSVGESNIFIGHYITPGPISEQVRIGYSNQIPIAADLSTNWVGLGGILEPGDESNKLDISGNTRIEGFLAISNSPGERTLDVNGNFRSQDGFGTLDFSNGVTRASGFASIRGSGVVSNGSNRPIGELKRGIVIVAVSSGSANFDGRTSFVLDTTTPTVSNLSSNKSATTTVNFTSNSINISNGTAGNLTYDWSITYFPLP